jgi:hypothetical protein
VLSVETKFSEIGRKCDSPRKWHAAVTEGQDPAAKRHGTQAREENIITLAATRGAQLMRASLHCERCFVLPVKVWKNAVIADGMGLDKVVYCNRIAAALTDFERDIVNAVASVNAPARLDVLDAIAINWALHILHFDSKYLWRIPC